MVRELDRTLEREIQRKLDRERCKIERDLDRARWLDKKESKIGKD